MSLPTSEYFEHTIPGVWLQKVQAYEVAKFMPNGDRNRIGWVIQADSDGEAIWVAWAVTSADGESFRGFKSTAGAAIQLLWDNENS